MKNKTNIAMRCNQEQWELLKPKVSHFDIKSANGFNESSYITNNFCNKFGVLASSSGGAGYGRQLFKNGIWATVIPTKTKKEAEELLNCKII